MEILKSAKGQVMVVTVKGKIDSNTSPELEKELNDIIDAGHKNIEINMAETTFLSSAGLRVLFGIQKNINILNGQMIITNADKDIKWVFQVTGFDKMLTII